MNPGEGRLIVYAKKAQGKHVMARMSHDETPILNAQVQESQENGKTVYQAVFRHLKPGNYSLWGDRGVDIGYAWYDVFADEETVADYR